MILTFSGGINPPRRKTAAAPITRETGLMSANYSIKRDLIELINMSRKLKEYILGDALYMPVGGGFFRGNTPDLTIGAFLLRRRRLTLLRDRLELEAQAELDAALAQHDSLQGGWRLHYERKLAREVISRLKLIGAFIRDCAENPRDCASAYPVEAMRRTILGEILLAMDEFDYDRRELMTRIHHADAALRRYFRPGPFIWAAELEAVYSSESFWWLYGLPDAGR